MKFSTYLKLSTILVAGLPVAALAQATETTAGVTGDDFASTEIVVTARKQSESLSDVPLAITAFDSSRIENQGISDLNDVARLTPGLNFTSVIGEFLPTPVIRGVTQTDLFGSDPNVAILIDGVYTGAREALNFAQADIERIEVVKGPQSALYGRNAFSGAINIISKRPTNDLSGRAEVVYGTGDRFSLLGSISVPLIQDKLGVKVTASHSEYGGSHKNLTGGPDLGGYDYDTIQSVVSLTPTPDFEIVGGIYYSEDEISPPAVSVVPTNCEFSRGVNQTFCGTIPSLPKAELSSHPDAYGQKRKVLRTFLDMKLNIGDWQVGWLTGYNKTKLRALTDAARGIPYTFRYRTTSGGIDTFETTLLREEGEPKFTEYSQEIRLTSPQEAPIRGGIGGFYFSGTQVRPNFDGISTTPLPADFVATFPIPGPWNTFFDGVNFDKTVTKKIENFALFGFAEADVTSRLTLRAELRYGREDQRTLQPASNIGRPSAAIDKRLRFTTWTPRFGVQYKATNDLMFYASAARGAKAGGFDINAPTEQFNPEYNWTYEAGVKGSWLNGRISADINAFYIDWSNIQIPILDFTQAPPVAVTRNLGNATSKGVEAQFVVRPVRPLTATFGVSYTDATYTDALNAGFSTFPSFAPDGDVSGNRLQAAAKWQLTSSLNYTQSLSSNVDGFLRTDVSYRSKQYMDSTNLTVLPSRTIVNLRAGLDSGTFRIEAFAENLFDNDRPTFAFRDVYLSNVLNGAPVIFPPRITVSHSRGREMGVRASVRF
ncbi:TonB-dependent receptor [Parasphingorhabdus sp. JC815]|uniref:TonB-dependent receptor n=1 Tax=Parasphingorhabdus sp. JC815 TaxID=3232140 RepID=UPI00345A9DA3